VTIDAGRGASARRPNISFNDACQSRDSVAASVPVTAVSRPIAPPLAVDASARAASVSPKRPLK